MSWGRPKRMVYMEKPRESMQVITCHFPKPWLEEMNEYVRVREFPNRSELIRFAVKTLLNELKSNES